MKKFYNAPEVEVYDFRSEGIMNTYDPTISGVNDLDETNEEFDFG